MSPEGQTKSDIVCVSFGSRRLSTPWAGCSCLCRQHRRSTEVEKATRAHVSASCSDTACYHLVDDSVAIEQRTKCLYILKNISSTLASHSKFEMRHQQKTVLSWQLFFSFRKMTSSLFSFSEMSTIPADDHSSVNNNIWIGRSEARLGHWNFQTPLTAVYC